MDGLYDERLSLNEVAKRLRVNSATAWRWALHGVRGRKLKTVMIGGRRWVLRDDLDEFLGFGEQSDQKKQVQESKAAVAAALLDSMGVG